MVQQYTDACGVQEAILNLLEFVVTSGLNCVAYQELVGLSCLLQGMYLISIYGQH